MRSNDVGGYLIIQTIHIQLPCPPAHVRDNPIIQEDDIASRYLDAI